MLKNKDVTELISKLSFNSKVITDLNQSIILDSTRKPYMFFNNSVITSFIFLADFVSFYAKSVYPGNCAKSMIN
jgi:hypothetical protein